MFCRNFGSWEVELSKCDFIFNIVLAIGSPLQFHTNLGISYSTSRKKKKRGHQIFYRLYSLYRLSWVVLLLFSCPVVSHYNMPSLPVPHHIPEFAQVHIQGINNAFQPSHSLLPSSPSAFNLSQHQGLFQWVHCSPASLVGDQSIGASASTSVLPMSIQGWFPLRLTGLISLLSEGLSRIFSNTTVWKYQFFNTLSSSWSSSHSCMWLLERPSPWLYGTLLAKWYLCFLTQSRSAIAFLPRSNYLLISQLQSQSIVILEPKKRTFVTAFTFTPSICHEVMQMSWS